MTVLAAPGFYWFFDLLALAGVAGMIVAALSLRGAILSERSASKDTTKQSPNAIWRLLRSARNDTPVAFLALWCAITFAALVYYNLALPAAQGRLLFPALAAWAVLWARGIVALVPARVQTGALVTLGAVQAIVAAATPGLFIAPAYAPTIVSALPVRATRGDGATMLAVRVNRAAAQPGDAFDLTVYSFVSDLQTARRAIFIHVVNSADIIIAQRDSAIASGNWNALTYPALIADSLRVEIPITVPAPDDWRVVVGTYDLESRERLGDPGTVAQVPARASTNAWQFDFDGRATLLRAEITPHAVARGDPLRVTLRWNAAPQNYRVFVHALGDADRIWAETDAALAREMELALHFAPDTPLGIYPLELGIYPANGDRVPVFDARGQLLGDRLFLGPIRVTP
jgi:hypothetical protein